MADTLEGWAYPLEQTVFGEYIADHTFVKAPNNGPAYFDCWGGHSGAGEYQVAGGSGPGNHIIADCCRGLDVFGFKDTAGIIYGIDGVCHQAANRFLLSACPWFLLLLPTVVVTNPFTGVRGGVASVLMYGTYGRSFPMWLSTYNTCKSLVAGLPLESPPKAAPESGAAAYHEALGALYAGYADRTLKGDAPSPFDHIRSEFEIVVKHALGTEFVTGRMAELQGALLKEKETVAASNAKGKDIAHRLNAAINSCLGKMATHLGADPYRKLFNLDPDVPLILVRPEIVAATQR
jgi:hypothetical protein